jgi:hypothetical protein
MDIYGLDEPTLRDVVAYIDEQLARDEDDARIAYSIAGLYSLPGIDRLRDDPDLDDVLGLAGSLEIPRGTKVSRDNHWRELRASLDRLRARNS